MLYSAARTFEDDATPRSRAVKSHSQTLLTGALAVAIGSLLFASMARADKNVAARAIADDDYTTRKFGKGTPELESYVFMEGNFYRGATVDHSIARMTFRQLAKMLAQELARQNFMPAKSPESSDLLIVVHWGTTLPYVSTQEMTAKTTWMTDGSNSAAGLARTNAEEISRAVDGDVTPPSLAGLEGESSDDMDRQLEFDGLSYMSEGLTAEYAMKTNVQLLGYSSELRRTRSSLYTTQKERTIRHDLSTERYFIIMRAYDLRKARAREGTAEPVWTVFLNVASPGNNFAGAVTKMANAGVDFFGRNIDTVTTVRPIRREGTVIIEEPVVLGTEE